MREELVKLLRKHFSPWLSGGKPWKDGITMAWYPEGNGVPSPVVVIRDAQGYLTGVPEKDFPELLEALKLESKGGQGTLRSLIERKPFLFNLEDIEI